ncbi:hypothetical protein COO60DRAFT_79718 [Scenedesmus sp. NREL 46B-D3]|nr:hypothetical protein COO60DRAFT_79718 [Scenedesmus sp. NREL 46B-D3]
MRCLVCLDGVLVLFSNLVCSGCNVGGSGMLHSSFACGVAPLSDGGTVQWASVLACGDFGGSGVAPCASSIALPCNTLLQVGRQVPHQCSSGSLIHAPTHREWVQFQHLVMHTCTVIRQQCAQLFVWRSASYLLQTTHTAQHAKAHNAMICLKHLPWASAHKDLVCPVCTHAVAPSFGHDWQWHRLPPMIIPLCMWHGQCII